MKKRKEVLAIIYCPTCKTKINLYELPDIGQDLEVKCPKCHDVLKSKITISEGGY